MVKRPIKVSLLVLTAVVVLGALAMVRCSSTTYIVLTRAPDARLWEAVMAKEPESVLTGLLSASPELVNESIDPDLTPLHLAIIFDRPDLVRLLLERGANPGIATHATQKEPVTPLELAVLMQRQECMRALLQKASEAELRRCIAIASENGASTEVLNCLYESLYANEPSSPPPLP